MDLPKKETVEEEKDAYDDAVPSLSDSEFNEDSDLPGNDTRDSGELAEYDRGILVEEEEREDLLTKKNSGPQTKGFFGRNSGGSITADIGKKKRRRKRRKHRRKGEVEDEDGALMFEMEEGGPKSDVSSEASSSSVGLDKLNASGRPRSKVIPTVLSCALADRFPSVQRKKHVFYCAIALAILVFFALLTLGAYNVSHKVDGPAHLKILSNGTTNFAPTTILISLDGFRADFLQRSITPTLKQFISDGISPKYMLPSFPSVTFPNHYTLVTGLYPESHGIVGNSFWDPDLQKEFFYTDPTRSMQPFWWSQGEPLWVTAEKQGLKTAVHMWPGSEAGMEFSATYLDKFNGSEILPRKTQRVLQLLDMDVPEADPYARPQLILAYVPNVDADGHKYGPNSTEIWDTISAVDEMLHNIFLGLEERNLTEIVNVVVVSDHGMATTSTHRVIQLDDLIDVETIEHTDGWPHFGLRPKDLNDLPKLHDSLSAEAEKNEGFDVYLRDQDMPERYHFSQNDRIAPLWVMPRAGWAIAKKDEFNVAEAKANGVDYTPKGVHGYDHEHPLMRAIFVAHGPAFPHQPNSRIENFRETSLIPVTFTC